MPWSEQERMTAMTSCRYCPMCHHADLVTTLSRRETYSPRGRGLTLFAIEKGKLGWDASVADVMYKFTTDGLSRQVCAGHINHDELVIDARRRLVKAGQAPAEVARVKANLERAGNPWGEPEADPAKLAGGKRGAEVVLFLGATARVRRPAAAQALGRILERAGVKFGTLEQEGDPGLLLYQLGEGEAALGAARALEERLRKAGAREVVTPDADAYRVLSAGAGDYPGAKGFRVRHAADVLEALAREGKLRFRPSARKVAVHDPCALARWAPVLDGPRALLRAVLGKPPLEFGWNRERAWCSGECGGLPFTNPDLAKAAAARRQAEARELGAEGVVTASPAAALQLSAAGPAEDLVEFVAGNLVD